jgi:hypothetical protein
MGQSLSIIKQPNTKNLCMLKGIRNIKNHAPSQNKKSKTITKSKCPIYLRSVMKMSKLQVLESK